jgi:protocatechuate 4,5-dioxygenase alpha subunit
MGREIMDTEIPGTTVFTGERSRQGYRLNRMAMSLSDPANRQRFCADEAQYMAQWVSATPNRTLYAAATGRR